MATASVAIDDAGTEVPMALAELHRELTVGATVVVRIAAARRWDDRRLDDVIVGAGFEPAAERADSGLLIRRLLTLPDTVGPAMRLLICGLNPSVHAAQMGVGFGRPGNRFWPAALAARLVTIDRDPDHTLWTDGIGMTDLVKRATPRAAQIKRDEYVSGLERVDRLVRWLQPSAICMVGLTGWRAATDRRATTGLQGRSVGGRPVYVMPSTSGLNAHAQLEELTEHLKAASKAAV